MTYWNLGEVSGSVTLLDGEDAVFEMGVSK